MFCQINQCIPDYYFSLLPLNIGEKSFRRGNWLENSIPIIDPVVFFYFRYVQFANGLFFELESGKLIFRLPSLRIPTNCISCATLIIEWNVFMLSQIEMKITLYAPLLLKSQNSFVLVVVIWKVWLFMIVWNSTKRKLYILCFELKFRWYVVQLTVWIQNNNQLSLLSDRKRPGRSQ